MNKHGIVQAFFVLACFCCTLPSRAADAKIEVSGPTQTLFDRKASKCATNIIPDSPARAFRRADGNVELIAPHYYDWMMVGKTLLTAQADCNQILDYDVYHRTVPGQLWIQATYTEDGQRIEGFASQDLSAPMREEGCNLKAGGPGHCWLNQIISIRSNDMGSHFSIGPVMASLGHQPPPANTYQFGFFSTTNIVKSGGYYYMLIYMTPEDPKQPSGDCLYRTGTLDKPLSWRGWTGSDFTYDPIALNGQCTRVTPAEFGIVRSLEYIPAKAAWIALTTGRHKMPGDSSNLPGIYSMTSADMMHWGDLTRVVQMPVAASDDRKNIYSYPSLIDPDSKSRNFDTIDHNSAVLFFSVNHLSSNGGGTMNRDLDYVRVNIE
jgi:hypothetical protein